MKISFSDFVRMMSWSTEGKHCMEVAFSIDGSDKYNFCWLGKMPDHSEKKRDCYWCGLVPDGSEAYDFYTMEDMLAAKLFDGKSMEEIWESVTLIEIDACEPEDRIQAYLS